ncbi:MAG: hypothetical protein H6711_32820 [Myxococcales bacterium]|nr:hypothetical protein [Myxococcales bacterium]
MWTVFSCALAVGCSGGTEGSGTDSDSTTMATESSSGSSASGTTGASASTSGGGSNSASASGTETGTTGGSATASTSGTTSGSTDTATDTTDTGSGTAVTVTDGMTTSGTTTGGDTTGGDTTGSTTGGDTTGGTTGGDTTTGGDDMSGLWLISIEDTSSPTRLYKIDLMDGHSTFLCELNTNDNYNTSTFNRNGLLYAANANTNNLEVIDPCTCERTIVGPTKVTALPGITADQAEGLYGLETNLDVFVALSTLNGNATTIGPLGINWGTGGLTWSDDLQDTYAINGTDDVLYKIDHLSGKATSIVKTSYNFGSVGIEWHPKTKEIYACSNSAELFQVDDQSGLVTTIGPMLLENKSAHCDNLAAPWVPVQCVEDKK